MQRKPDTFDALVVGARCAGAATALLLARAGLRVLMIDRAREIGDTLSTHAIMRPGVMMLDRLGVLPAIMAAGTPAVTRTRFVYGSDVIDIPVRPVGSAAGLCAPRRFLLDRLLCDAAVAAGADLALGTAFEGALRGPDGRVIGALARQPGGSLSEIRADLVIGADGRTSRVAEAVGAQVLHRDETRAATRFGYFDGIPNEGYRWYFDRGLQAGVIPTTAGQHCVFLSCRPSELRDRFGTDPLGAMVDAFGHRESQVADALRAARGSVRLRQFPGAPGFIRDCAGPGWALVGDAGYFKDPATAHGITDALLDANRLARAVLQPGDGLASYRDERDRHALPLFAITQRIASFDWDFGQLGDLHRQLNEQMKREAAGLETARNDLAA
ncbi:MAG: FAD-dependent monooxygenase [Pseudooceanicola sp.]|nr:FAD-dependent monooxygenase [Pseudooceanicola sp.]